MARVRHSKVRPYSAAPVHTFHRSLGPTLLLAQLFGLFPVSGVLDASPRYRRRSLRVFISLVNIVATSTITVLGAFWTASNITVFRATKVLFFASSVAACTLLHRLACAWPRLARDWRHAEIVTAHIGYPPNTVLYCRVFACIFFIIAIVEHTFAVTDAVVRIAGEDTWTGVFRRFYIKWFPQVVMVVPYTPLLGPPVVMLNILATFTFSYLDLLIIVITYCLSGMFRQFNKHMIKVSEQEFPRPYWGDLYQDYQVLRNLVTKVDSHISRMVLVSFTVDTYHICLQLYHSLRPLPTTASKIYFALSFGFLIMRTAGVCISAANIHEEAAACKYVLFAVPPQEYCDDVERFIFQVCNDHVAISGFNFFIITRRTLLTIIGLAITYEVVMFQVNTMAEDEDEGKQIKNTTLTLTT